jgi:hypothetical protein
VSNTCREDRAGHGTEARARRHYREGDRPLRRHCPSCAEASLLAHRIRGERRARENDGTG